MALLAASTATGESCRIAYDMGSSGIRAGASGSALTTQVGIDYLDPLWAGRGLEDSDREDGLQVLRAGTTRADVATAPRPISHEAISSRANCRPLVRVLPLQPGKVDIGELH